MLDADAFVDVTKGRNELGDRRSRNAVVAAALQPYERAKQVAISANRLSTSTRFRPFQTWLFARCREIGENLGVRALIDWRLLQSWIGRCALSVIY